MVADSKGFEWRNERPDAATANDEKWGWVATKPGAWALLDVDSRSTSDGGDLPLADRMLRATTHRTHELLNAFNKLRPPVTDPLPPADRLPSRATEEEGGGGAPGPEGSEAPQSQVLLGYLASYSGMGQASVECVSGCACNSTVVDSHWEERVSLQVMHRVLVRRRRGAGAGRCGGAGGALEAVCAWLCGQQACAGGASVGSVR